MCDVMLCLLILYCIIYDLNLTHFDGYINIMQTLIVELNHPKGKREKKKPFKRVFNDYIGGTLIIIIILNYVISFRVLYIHFVIRNINLNLMARILKI